MPFDSPNASRSFRRILKRNIALPLLLAALSALVFLGLLAYLASVIAAVQRSDELLSQASSAQRHDLDMESGMRGFLVSGDPRFLQQYDRAASQLAPAMERLRGAVRGDQEQSERLDRIGKLQATWAEYARDRITQKRLRPESQVNVTPGRELKDRVWTEFDEFYRVERRARAERIAQARNNAIGTASGFVLFMLGVGGLLAWRGRSDLVGLSSAYEVTLQERLRQAEVLQAHAWLREGQARLSQRLAGEQGLSAVGHAALETLSQHLGVVVGALYTPEPGGFRLAAAWGWAPQAGDVGDWVPEGRTLLAECAAQRTPIELAELPAGYLRVSSSLGEATVRSALLAPVEHEGRLAGVLELGWLRPLEKRDGELVGSISGLLGSSIESARFRERLQEALARTQQLNEELQVQQEELRTANEELAEQARALQESQAHLENQQAELEQTNAQLAEQGQRLEAQRDQLRQAQGALEQRAADLQRASNYKSEFLANMSHELRTPLNSSLILARLLADNAQGNLTEEQVRFAESIHASGNDLLGLINDILDIAKVEAGKLEVRPEVTPIVSVCESLKSMFGPLAARKGLQLHLELADDLPRSLHTDRQRLEQILRNLVANAVKFTEHGSVALRVAPSGQDAVRFEVRDSGIGIEPSQQELIFEAFRQADGTASRKFGGTGLGLSISRDLARLLGGDITVESTPGEGSTFTLVLPLEYRPALAQAPLALASPAAASRAAASAPAPGRPAPFPGAMPAPAPAPPPSFADDRALPANGRRTVLVVEDDPQFAGILFTWRTSSATAAWWP
jgi:signal transduction histidine kinase/CHASE3 domain sensor protein